MYDTGFCTGLVSGRFVRDSDGCGAYGRKGEETMNREKRMDIGGGYTLVRDPYCCWIEAKHIVTKGKHEGNEVIRRVSGYHPTVESALLSLSDVRLRKIDAESIQSLIDEIKTLKSNVQAWARAIEEQEGRR